MNLVPWRRNRSLADDDFWAPLAPFGRDWFRDFFTSDIFPRDFFAPERPGAFSPALNVEEDENAYRISAELPGMDPKEVEVSLDNGVLTLRGEKKEESEKKERNYHRVERRYGSFTRSLALPAEVDGEKVSANYRNGVLEITLPKAETAKPKQIAVKVEK